MTLRGFGVTRKRNASVTDPVTVSATAIVTPDVTPDVIAAVTSPLSQALEPAAISALLSVPVETLPEPIDAPEIMVFLEAVTCTVTSPEAAHVTAQSSPPPANDASITGDIVSLLPRALAANDRDVGTPTLAESAIVLLEQRDRSSPEMREQLQSLPAPRWHDPLSGAWRSLSRARWRYGMRAEVSGYRRQLDRRMAWRDWWESWLP